MTYAVSILHLHTRDSQLGNRLQNGGLSSLDLTAEEEDSFLTQGTKYTAL